MSRRTRTWAHSALILVVVLLSLSVVSAQDGKPEPVGLRPDAPTYALHGPYWVGTREFLVNAGKENEIPFRAWYPALNPEMAAESVIYAMRPDAAFRMYTDPERSLTTEGYALRNAKADLSAAPYPLFVLSHAYTAFSESQYYLSEHLASYGFVVLAPDHKGDTWDVMYAPTIRRIQEVVAVIAYAESLTAADGELAGMIDTEHVGVGGWSSGGTTTYGAANAPIDWKGVEEYCGVIPDGSGCANLDKEHEAALAALGLKTEPEGLWPAIGDPRVDAIVSMSGGADLYGQRGLAEVRVPMLGLNGSVETEATWFAQTYDHIASTQKAHVVFEGANHFIFGSGCATVPWMIELGAYEWCSDAVWDMDRAHDMINYFATAFLLDVLKGDQDAHAALAPDAVTFPGIEYQAEGF